MHVNEFASQFKEFADGKYLVDEKSKITLPDSYIKRIKDCINCWIKNSQTVIAKKELNDFLKNPTNKNGTVYEILAYQWFHKCFINVEYQPEISKESTLKATGEYRADGRLDDEVVFDIKSFSFGQPLYSELQNELNKMWNTERERRIREKIERDGVEGNGKYKGEIVPDYYIMVSGDYNLSSQKMSELLKKKEDIFKTLFSEDKKNYTDYIYCIKDYGLQIRAHYNKPGKVNIHTGVSEVNVDKWAMQNEIQVLKHCSQFCRNSPFFLMYPYDKSKARDYYFDGQTQFYTFRTLMRRSFINLLHNKDYINGYDGKAISGMRVCEAIRKLSGVFFLDVTEEYEYGKNNAFLFINPNADNPLRELQVEHFFNLNGVTIYDFYFDNY